MSFPVLCVFTPTQLSFRLEALPKALQTNNHYISFDAEFYADSEFLVKIFDSNILVLKKLPHGFFD